MLCVSDETVRRMLAAGRLPNTWRVTAARKSPYRIPMSDVVAIMQPRASTEEAEALTEA